MTDQELLHKLARHVTVNQCLLSAFILEAVDIETLQKMRDRLDHYAKLNEQSLQGSMAFALVGGNPIREACDQIDQLIMQRQQS